MKKMKTDTAGAVSSRVCGTYFSKCFIVLFLSFKLVLGGRRYRLIVPREEVVIVSRL